MTFNPQFLFFLQEEIPEQENEELKNIPDNIVVPLEDVQGAFREEEITSDNSEFDKVFLSENVSFLSQGHAISNSESETNLFKISY
jgi:hypothetical protein